MVKSEFLLKSFVWFGIVTLVSGLSFLALAAQEATAESEEETRHVEYTLTMTEYQFALNDTDVGTPLELEVGTPYTLHFVHAGTVEHEVLIGKNAIEIGENMHLDFETNLLDDVEVEIAGMMNNEPFVIGAAGMIEFELNPGQDLTISFTLPEEKIGDWDIACFVYLLDTATDENPSPTHYDVNMRIPVHIVAAK
jgi:hypothetical protein